LISELTLKLNTANSRADLLKVEVDHFRRELEKEQHRGSDIENQTSVMGKDQMAAELARLKLESNNLRDDLKTARSDWENARKEEKLLREEINKIKQRGGIVDDSALNQKWELQTQKHNIELQKMQLEIQKAKDDKARNAEDLASKKAELEKLKLESDKLRNEITDLRTKLDKNIKENDEKVLQLKTTAEKNFLEAERQKIEAGSHKRRIDEISPKLEEMTRNQGYLQRQVAELEAMNQNLSMRVSLNDQQHRLNAVRPSIMTSDNQVPILSSAYGDLNGGYQGIDPLRSSNRVCKSQNRHLVWILECFNLNLLRLNSQEESLTLLAAINIWEFQEG
jgi:chromosome segregation ATPase